MNAMQRSYIALEFPTVPAPLTPTRAGRPLTQRLSEDTAFLRTCLRDSLNLMQPFHTRSRYAAILAAQHQMLCDKQRLHAEEELRQVMGEHGQFDADRPRRVEADLRALRAWPTPPVSAMRADLTVLEALGWVYASEALLLGLDALARANLAGPRLGLSAAQGGSHLAAPFAKLVRAWRSFARALDAQSFTDEQATAFVAGACLAYHRLDELLSLALAEHPDTR